MPKVVDLTDEKFGELVVIKIAEIKNHVKKWECLCSCGNKTIVAHGNLRNGQTKSCGHLRKKHEMEGTPTYKIWANMRQRCLNQKDHSYKYYGGRGITICDSWKNSFISFFNDMGQKPVNLTIDRIENDKGYFKDNCRWATQKQQANNKRRQSLFKNNKTGVQGVHFDKLRKKWAATIMVNRKRYYLGRFVLLQEAINARQKAVSNMLETK